MEKRCNLVGQERNWASCRAVLQRGLLLNRDAPALLQAWGLMEMQVGWARLGWLQLQLQVWWLSNPTGGVPLRSALPCLLRSMPAPPALRLPTPFLPPTCPPACLQRGNWLAALLLLDRSARLEPRNRPVLRWRPVVEARQTVGSRRAAAASKPGSQASDS